MKFRRIFKSVWGICLIGFIFVSVPCVSWGAEDPAKYPSKPITLIVPWGVGGSTDLSCRRLADATGKILGQSIVVENKAGGGGVIGQAAGAKAAPDGYTLVSLTHSSSVIVPHLRSVPYSMKKDFTYILQYGSYGFVFCCLSESPWKTFKDFVKSARSKPGELKFASSGPQSAQHIFMEQVFASEKVKATHIPTSGGAEATRQLLGGHLDAAITPDIIPHIKSGKVRGLGVQGVDRVSWIPDIPTFYELGYKIPTVNWMGIGAPAGLHPAIQKKLSAAFKKAFEDPDFRDSMNKLYLPLVYKDGEAYKQMVVQDFDNMGKVLKELGLTKK